jgi:hypothetical protein
VELETMRRIDALLEDAEGYAREPLRNDLEVGFRHSPLSPKEITQRYAEACALITRDIEEARKLLAALQPSGQTLPKPGRNDGGEPCGECHLQPGETCDICGAAHPSGQTRQVKLDRVNAIAEELLQQLDAFQSNQHHSFVTTQQMAREAATVIRLLQAALQPSGQTRAGIIEECAKVAEWAHMVPPDGGSPTEEERAVAEAAARNIRALAAQEKEKTQT